MKELLYCQGYPKPRLRGVLHSVSALAWPIYASWLWRAAGGRSMSQLAVGLNLFGTLFSFASSGLLHRIDWKDPASETMLMLVDHAAIFWKIAGHYAIPSIMLSHHFPHWLSVYTQAALWGGAVIGSLGVAIGHSNPITFVGYGVIAIIPSGVMVAPLLSLFHKVVACTAIILFVGASMVYGYRYLDWYPSLWGFHENVHLMETLATFLMLFLNYEVLMDVHNSISEV